MTTYSLFLIIDQDDLEAIYSAQENLIIAKVVDSPNNTPNIAWLSFHPLEANTVEWTEQYAIYAQLMQSEFTETSYSPYPAERGVCYPMTNDGFQAPVDCLVPVPQDSYGGINQNQSAFTFGLAQSSPHFSDQPSPINAEIIPANQQVVFTPTLAVWVWLQSGLAAGAPVNFEQSKGIPAQATSAPAVIKLTPSAPSATLRYNSSIGKFVPPT
jgi:hypothetical protein